MGSGPRPAARNGSPLHLQSLNDSMGRVFHSLADLAQNGGGNADVAANPSSSFAMVPTGPKKVMTFDTIKGVLSVSTRHHCGHGVAGFCSPGLAFPRSEIGVRPHAPGFDEPNLPSVGVGNGGLPVRVVLNARAAVPASDRQAQTLARQVDAEQSLGRSWLCSSYFQDLAASFKALVQDAPTLAGLDLSSLPMVRLQPPRKENSGGGPPGSECAVLL